jgi:hypothetical protein
MKKLALAALIVAFAGACSHKAAQTDKKPADQTPAPTKDQAPGKNKKTKKSAVASTAATVKCTHNSDERMIEIKDKDGGCETVYTKMGEANSIASSSHGNEHCQQVSEKIQKNLTSAGFTCQ